MKSNCLIEAIKQKTHDHKTRVFIGFHKKNILRMHCWWMNDNQTFHFCAGKNLKFMQTFWHSGDILQVNKRISMFYYHFEI